MVFSCFEMGVDAAGRGAVEPLISAERRAMSWSGVSTRSASPAATAFCPMYISASVARMARGESARDSATAATNMA